MGRITGKNGECVSAITVIPLKVGEWAQIKTLTASDEIGFSALHISCQLYKVGDT